MNRGVIPATLLLVGFVFGGEELDYSSLRAGAWAQDPATDFRNLRFAAAERHDYDPFFSISPEYRRALHAVRDGNPDVATTICKTLPTTYFVAIQMQVACADRMDSMGQAVRAEQHRFIADGLLFALKPNAAGEIVIINPDEQYDYTSLKGYEILSHATFAPDTPGGKPRSGLEVRDENGSVSWVVFVKHPAYERYVDTMIDDALDSADRDRN